MSKEEKYDFSDIQKYIDDKEAQEKADLENEDNELQTTKNEGRNEEYESDDDNDELEAIPLKSKIMLYLNSEYFSDFLKKSGYGNKFQNKIQDMDSKTLKKHLKRIESQVVGRTQGKYVENVVFASANIVEGLSDKFKGLSAKVRANKEILCVAEEIRIKNSENLFIESPYKRLFLLFGFDVGAVSQENKTRLLGQAILEGKKGEKANITPDQMNALNAASFLNNNSDPFGNSSSL